MLRIEPQLPMSWQAYGNCDLYPKDILIKWPQLAKIVSQSHDSIGPDLEIHFLDYSAEIFKVSNLNDETTSLQPYSFSAFIQTSLLVSLCILGLKKPD